MSIFNDTVPHYHNNMWYKVVPYATLQLNTKQVILIVPSSDRLTVKERAERPQQAFNSGISFPASTVHSDRYKPPIQLHKATNYVKIQRLQSAKKHTNLPSADKARYRVKKKEFINT